MEEFSRFDGVNCGEVKRVGLVPFLGEEFLEEIEDDGTVVSVREVPGGDDCSEVETVIPCYAETVDAALIGLRSGEAPGTPGSGDGGWEGFEGG